MTCRAAVRRPQADALDVFDLGTLHVLTGPAICAGFVCERCGAYFATVDAALAVTCKAAA